MEKTGWICTICLTTKLKKKQIGYFSRNVAGYARHFINAKHQQGPIIIKISIIFLFQSIPILLSQILTTSILYARNEQLQAISAVKHNKLLKNVRQTKNVPAIVIVDFLRHKPWVNYPNRGVLFQTLYLKLNIRWSSIFCLWSQKPRDTHAMDCNHKTQWIEAYMSKVSFFFLCYSFYLGGSAPATTIMPAPVTNTDGKQWRLRSSKNVQLKPFTITGYYLNNPNI